MGDQPRLFPWPGQKSIGPTLDRQAIIDEVQSGLRNEKGRLADAAENQAFLDLGGKLYIERREAETEFDYAGRIKKTTGLVHQCVNRLCQHTYNPGPMRTVVGDKAAEELLESIWKRNHIDAVMNEAEQLSTVNDVACIQATVPLDEETRQRKPIDLQIWGSEEFAVFLDPDDQRRPYAVVVIDKVDETTRYRLWFSDLVYEFRTKKLDSDETRGGVIAFQWGDPEPNDFGCLPFAFVPYKPQVRHFWPQGPGTFLREAEKDLNLEVSDLAEAILKYGKPIGLFLNVSPEENVEIGPGRFIRLVRGGSAYSGDGFEGMGDPDAKYLQAQLAIEAIWHDIQQTAAQVAEAVDLPSGALRLEYNDAASGVSIVIKNWPLLARARQRRPIYQWAETELARTICRCYGAYYGDAAIAAAAVDLDLVLSWPEPRIPIPGPERDQCDDYELMRGTKSRVMIVQERYGLGRDQAIQHCRQVAEDEAAIAGFAPPLNPVGAAQENEEPARRDNPEPGSPGPATNDDDGDGERNPEDE